jgi:hypothetical protein
MGFIQRFAVADGHETVLELVSLADVVVDIVGGHRGHQQLFPQSY